MKKIFLFITFIFILFNFATQQALAQGSGRAIELNGTTGYVKSTGQDPNLKTGGQNLIMEGWFKFDDVTKSVFLIDIANTATATPGTPPYRTQKAIWWSGNMGELNIPANQLVVTFRDATNDFAGGASCTLVDENKGKFWDISFPFTLSPNVWYHISALVKSFSMTNSVTVELFVNGIALTSSNNVLITTPSGTGMTCNPTSTSNLMITPSTTVNLATVQVGMGDTKTILANNDAVTDVFLGMRPEQLDASNTYTGGNVFLFDGQIDQVRIGNFVSEPPAFVGNPTIANARANMCNKSRGNWVNYTFDEVYNGATGFVENGQNAANSPAFIVGGVTQVTSGAPIGDASSFTYGGTNLTLNYPPSGTSTFGVNVTAGTSNVLHIYRVNSLPNDVNLPSQMSNFDTRYFGIFTGTDNITYDAIYTYTNNTAPNPPLNASPTALAVARRDRNNSGIFNFQTGTVNTGTTTHTVTGLTMDLSAATPRNQQEFIYGSISDPVLANIEGMVIAYSEGAGNPTTNPTVQITNNITVTYGGNLTSATVSISGGFAEDLLEFTAIMGNPVTFGSFAGGVLTLTGSATAAQYQAALRAVTYRNTSDAPNTTARTVTFRVIDGMKQSNTQQRTINITAVNDAPALSMQTCSGNTFTEDGAAVVILTGITVADPDNTSLNTASVTITNVQASDLLSFTTIMGNPVTSAGYNAATGLLTLNVNGASHAQLAAALQAVTFSNSSQNPNTTARTIRFVVRDASLNSGNIDCTINVNSVNDKPVIAPATSTVTYNKLASAINIASSATVSDIDNTTLTALTLNIGNYNAGEDVITFTCPMGVTCPAVGAAMSFTGTVTLANYQALIRSFTYRNSSGTPMGANRTFTFVANDGQAANNLSDDAVFTVNINANFNIAPTLDAGCPTMTANFNENQSPLAIFPNPLTITDLDNTNLSKAEFKITTGYRSGEDELLYDDDVTPLPGTLTATWNATTGTLSIEGVETIAGYLNILARIKYKNESERPTAGNRTITAQFFDNGFPDGTLGNIKTTNICTLRINVIPSNDPPVLDNLEANISYTEDEAAKALTALITVEDKDNDNMANATISIISNYFPDQDVLEFANQLGITGAWNATTGILTLTGASSKANYQTALRNVKYKNTSQRPSNSVREVSFKVNDGQADSNIPTINLTVIPVNDSPVLANVETNKLGYTEGEVAKIITSTITVIDIDDDNIESATITISGGFAEDILSFTPIMGNPVSLGSFVSGVLTLTGTATKAQYEAALRNVKYNNTSNQPNIGDRTVSFKINDGDIDSNIPTRIISVGGVNNKPVINYTPTIQTYTEGEIPANKVIFPQPANFTIVDLDNTNLVRATITISGNYFSEDVLVFTNQNGITGSWNAGSGVLTLTGSASVANYITAIRSITYANTSENPSNLQRTLTIVVNDGIENSDAVNQLINVLPVNDLPTVINIQRATNINGQVKIERVHFLNAYGDIENDALQKIAITSLPINGQLVLNNVPVVINQQIAGSDFVLNYIPNKDFTGDDFFEWKAADRTTATNIATEYSTIPARVNIQVGLPDLYPPSKLKAQAGSKQILLSWEPVAIEGLEISYEVYLFAPNQPQRLIEVTKENKLLIKGLDNTVTYVLRVQAVDNIGRNSGLSDPISARPSIVLGTEDNLSDLQLNLYPNPNTGDFIIQFVEKNNKQSKLFIINTLGQKVFEKELQSLNGNYEEKIEANLLSEGAYILQISTDKNTYQRRFLIQK